MAYYNFIMVKMLDKVLRTVCIITFMGGFLFVWAIYAQDKNNSKGVKHSIASYKTVSSTRIKYKSVHAVSQRSYAPNIIYLGDKKPQKENMVKLRSRMR